MDKNNKNHKADLNATTNKKNDRTEFADEMNTKDTQAKTNKQNTK